MIKQYKTVFKFICFVLILINQSFPSQQLALPKNALAEVGSTKILASDFIARYSDYILSSGIKDNIVTRRAILNNMINEVLLRQYDENKNIFENPEYQRELKWAEKQTILAFLKDREVYAKMKVTEAELRDAFYKTNMKISARHLYAETEEEAKSLHQLLQTGASFNTLAKQVFSDTTLRNNGGYLGFFSWGDMDPAFEDAAYSLKPGEISEPIKTQLGYSVIKVEERVPNPLLTENEFLNKKRHMERVVRMRRRGTAEREYISKHFSPGKVSVDKKMLSKTLDYLTYSPSELIEASPKELSSGALAKYKNKTYTQKEIVARINEIPIFHRVKVNSLQTLDAVIKGFVLQDILMELAEKKGYAKSEEALNTVAKYRNNIFLKYKRAEIAEAKIFTEEEIRKFYSGNSVYFKKEDQLNLQEIIVDRKDLADSLFNAVKSEADFGELAVKFSKRDWSAKNKGVMGFAEISKFGGLKDTLVKSEVGSLLGPVKIQEMYGIFKLLGKKEGEVVKFQDAKALAEKLLRKEKSKSIMEEYITGLRKKTIVKWDDQLLSTLNVN